MDATLSIRARTKLRIFTLYADFPAGIRAKHLVTQMSRLADGECQIASEMWKLDSVFPAGAIRRMIIEGAGESDVLLVAAGTLDQPDPEVIEWLNSLLECKMNRSLPGLLIGLLGDEDHRVDDNHWLVRQLENFGQQTGMRFAWARAIGDSVGNAGWLAADLRSIVSDKRRTDSSLTFGFDVTGK